MKLMFLNLGVIYAMTFLFMNHPLSLGLMLMIQTAWISLIIGLISKTFWFSYILFITFLGGMLILFIYMTSLSSPEKFNFSMQNLIWFVLLLMALWLNWMTFPNNFYINFYSNSDSFSNLFKFINMNILSLNKIYNFPNHYLSLYLIIYLLITLIITVKISEKFKGPMRKNF